MVSGTKDTGLKIRLEQIKIQTSNVDASLGKQYRIFVRSRLYIDRFEHSDMIGKSYPLLLREVIRVCRLIKWLSFDIFTP